MAFQAPNVGQGRANRKILEELEEKKKQLQRMQTQNPAPMPSQVSGPPVMLASHTAPLPTDVHPMTSAQRSALQHAHANSVGYFITQDSSYGNLILPVLPRFDK